MNRAQRRKTRGYKFSQLLREGYAAKNLEMIEKRELRAWAKAKGVPISDTEAEYLLSEGKEKLKKEKDV